jgi:lipid-A-disaccharide synthase
MENSEQSNKIFDIVILVNGPGELASYARPTIEALNNRSINKRIIIVFTPCPYSTGKEFEIARKIPEVTEVIDKSVFTKWALFGMAPKNISFNPKGIVVFLGGDVLYGKIIAKKLKYPAIAYTEAYAKWPNIYKKYLVPDRMIYEKFKKQGFPEDQIKIVGNLMVDGIKISKTKEEIFKEFGLDPQKRLISFLPGSREFQVSYTFKFFSRVAEEIQKLLPNTQFGFVISPFLPEKIFNKYSRQISPIIKTVLKGQHEVIKASDLVITVPGTNTAEVAIIGTPMISVFPYGNAHLIPFDGIYEIIGRIPVLGFIFKKYYVKILLSKPGFFAIPNIKSGKEIIPELKGNIQPKQIADMAKSLLNNNRKLEEMKRQLIDSLGSPGAAEKIAEEINETLLQTS